MGSIKNKKESFSSLTLEQREAVGLLSIGTFLEYFDLMIYIHMAVLLNELFFPKTDPHMSNLISAMAFCSTFIFRPIGAMIFGYIGDTVGRKATVVITTFMMAISCVVMAGLPTYAQIGITAAWAITTCRIIQGLSCMGEDIGAQIYLTELIKVPIRYSSVSIMECAACLGSTMALIIATAVFAIGLEWRTVFLVGALIALVGSIARTALRETPVFINAKLLIKNTLDGNIDIDQTILKNDPVFSEKIALKTSLAYFVIKCARPVWFYFGYIHCGNILKYSLYYSPTQIIRHNLIVSIIGLIGIIGVTYLSSKMYPLKIIKIKIIIFSIFILFMPYLLYNVHTPWQLLFIQSFVCFFPVDSAPADAILLVHFPVFKRFTYASIINAIASALMYVVVSFGMVYLVETFSHWGLLIIMIPTIIGVTLGILHFEKLEKETENRILKLN